MKKSNDFDLASTTSVVEPPSIDQRFKSILNGIITTILFLALSSICEAQTDISRSGFDISHPYGLSTGYYFYHVSAVDSTGFEGSKSYAATALVIPTIASFTPTYGSVGTTVTITGTGFNTTATNNIVYLGAVKAVVSSATSTSLNVTVPVGATFAPITSTDTTTGLTAYSNKPFVVTFQAYQIIDATSFAAKIDFASGSSPNGLSISDLDGDGKPDIIVANESSNNISLYRNTSTSGSIASNSFAAKVDLTTGSGPHRLAVGDIDGDAKHDIVVANWTSNTISIFRNVSTIGSIVAGSFSSKVDIPTTAGPNAVTLADIDGDGKTDILVAGAGSDTISVFRNIGSIGNLSLSSFQTAIYLTSGTTPASVAVGDLDGDGKPDMAISNSNSSTVTIFRNTSSAGVISFAAKADLTTGSIPFGANLADLDGDGNMDVIVPNYGSGTVSLFRNTSSVGSISFAAKQDVSTGSNPSVVSIGDLDGDSKPDMVVGNYGSGSISVFRSKSTTGSLSASSFAPKIDYSTGFQMYGVALGDLDGDGKPDIAVINYNNSSVSIFRNVIPLTTLWKMQVKAAIGSALDNENYVGVADSATEIFDPSFDMPELPPAPANYVSLYFPHPEWGSVLGNDFSVDIKEATLLADTVKRWYFQVKSDVVNDTVALSFLNDRIPSAFGRYLTDLKTGKRTNLKNTTFYKYYNSSDTARSFMLIVGDSIAPQLTLTTPYGSNVWRSGTSKTLQWSTSDGTGIDSIFVYSSANSGTNYSLSKSLGYSQSTSWTVPNEYLNNNYSVKLISRDSLGNQSAVRSAKTFTVVGDSLATSSAAGWSLMSLPLQPSDSIPAKIIGDDFGSNPYYLGSYNQATGYVIPTVLQFGKGYWLGVTATSAWDLRGAAIEADSTVVDLPIGYSIVGSGFVRNVPKQGISLRKTGVNYSFADAVTAGILVNAIYGYNGTSYATKDTLEMFKGYWLGILQSDVQMIQRPVVSTVTPLLKMSKPTLFNWDLPIAISSSSQTDQFAKIGVRPNATNDFDVAFDVPRPPRAPGSNYIELYFPHTGLQYPAILGSKYALDYRGTNNPQWSLTVESSDSGQVTLLWDNTILTQFGNSVRLTLIDVATSTSIDMTKQNSYVFTYSVPRNFNIASVITGLSGNGEAEPLTFALGQNYPNPFNPSTQIQFSIPQSCSVTLKVYDVLGKEVASLVAGDLGAGAHSVTWNAEKIPSGVYFYRLQAGAFSETKKLVLLK